MMTSQQAVAAFMANNSSRDPTGNSSLDPSSRAIQPEQARWHILAEFWRLDPSLVLLSGLSLLFVWRVFCGYGCCGQRWAKMNHAFGLYLLLGALLFFGCLKFILTASEDKGNEDHTNVDLGATSWLRPFIWGSPVALLVAVVLAATQTREHMQYILAGRAAWKHDMAVQIIAIPAVFGIMMLHSLVPMYQMALGKNYGGRLTAETWKDKEMQADDLYDSCFFVAEVYEAWALYQFGMLTLELVKSGIERSKTTRASSDRTVGDEAQDEVLASHAAVASLMWLGTFLFIAVCLAQCIYSFMNMLSGHLGDEESKAALSQFEIAGIVASSAAIYNVHVVESSFHHHLQSYRPLTKFLSVKILVSLGFVQSGIIAMAQTLYSWQPDTLRGVIHKVPFFGDILNFTDVEFRIFYPALLMYECLISAALHSWAWSPSESWYDEDANDETKALFA